MVDEVGADILRAIFDGKVMVFDERQGGLREDEGESTSLCSKLKRIERRDTCAKPQRALMR